MKIVSSERGFGVFLMLFLVFIFSVMTLLHFNRLLSHWQQLCLHEKRYYHDYNQAYSSLIWGQFQHWRPPSRHWQCRSNFDGSLKACIKQYSQTKMILLKGISKTLPLYWIGILGPSGNYEYLAGHWLDHCPAKKVSECE